MPSIRKKKAQRPKRVGVLAAVGLAAGSGAAVLLGRKARARQNEQ